MSKSCLWNISQYNRVNYYTSSFVLRPPQKHCWVAICVRIKVFVFFESCFPFNPNRTTETKVDRSSLQIRWSSLPRLRVMAEQLSSHLGPPVTGILWRERKSKCIFLSSSSLESAQARDHYPLMFHLAREFRSHFSFVTVSGLKFSSDVTCYYSLIDRSIYHSQWLNLMVIYFLAQRCNSSV